MKTNQTRTEGDGKEVLPALVVFDCGEAFLHGRGTDGRIDFDHTIPWPRGWPVYINARFLDDLRIPWRAV